MAVQTPPGAAPQAVPTSSTAILSLIAGIVGLTIIPFIGSIVAVVTGPMAKKEIRASGGALGGDGLATAGIILGWIGIGLGVLALCGGTAAIGIPVCLAALGLATYRSSSLVPLMLAVL